jgi:hypothetical protein
MLKAQCIQPYAYLKHFFRVSVPSSTFASYLEWERGIQNCRLKAETIILSDYIYMIIFHLL